MDLELRRDEKYEDTYSYDLKVEQFYIFHGLMLEEGRQEE